MSGGTSAGNIVTEAAATYAARTWVDVAKADAYGIISDAQLASIVGANWFNNVDDNLKQVNAWFNGTGEAAHIRAAEATIGTVAFTTLEAESAMIGTGALTDAPSTADDVVIGALDAVDRGLSILSTSVARLGFVDTSGVFAGYISYTHASDMMAFGIAGATEVNLSSTALYPSVDSGLSLGTSAFRYQNAYVNNTVVVGQATGSPSVTLNKDDTGNGDVTFQVEGTSHWRLRHRTDESFAIERVNGGVLTDAVTFDRSTGGVAFPGAVSTGSDLTVGGGFSVTNSATFSDAVTVADLTIDSSPAYLTFKEGGTTKVILTTDSGFAIQRYVAGAYADSVVYDLATGAVTMPLSLVVGSATAALPILGLSKDDATTATLAFYNESIIRWGWLFDSSENLLLRRYSAAGALLGTCTFDNGTGLWTLTNDLTMTGTRTLTVGDGTGSTEVVIDKSGTGAASLTFKATSTTRWQWQCDSSENLNLGRYNSSGVFQDQVAISNSTGEWSFPGGIGVSGQSTRILAGSGVPSAGLGTNGSLYIRTDGTVSTCLYYKIGGAWSVLGT